MFEGLKVVVGLISFILVYRTVTGNCNKYLAFAICAIWLRFFLSAFHTITYPSLVAGFSINALGSIGVAGLGLLLIPTAVFTLRKLFPYYLFFAAIAASGIVNFEIPGTINVLVKWCYFLVLSGALFLSIRMQGHAETFKKLAVAFVMPVTLQVFSLLLGEVKATEADGSASYIGGYNHEAAFSMIIASFVFVIGLTERGSIRFRSLLFTSAVILLMLVNYRTSMLAVLPIVAVFYYNLVEQRIQPSQKVPVMTIVVMFIAVAFMGLSLKMSERFADVGTLISNLDLVLKAPIYFSEMEKDIMSARVYIWSQYINAFIHADLLNQLLGFGPGSWSSAFNLYAHNTFVSYLYEYGLLGLLMFLFLCVSTVLQTLSMADSALRKLMLLSFLGFLAMNMATMPLWNIEGLIFFSLIGAQVFASKPPTLRKAPISSIEKVMGINPTKGNAI